MYVEGAYISTLARDPPSVARERCPYNSPPPANEQEVQDCSSIFVSPGWHVSTFLGVSYIVLTGSSVCVVTIYRFSVLFRANNPALHVSRPRRDIRLVTRSHYS